MSEFNLEAFQLMRAFAKQRLQQLTLWQFITKGRFWKRQYNMLNETIMQHEKESQVER